MSRGYEWEKQRAVTLGSHDCSVPSLTGILSEGCPLFPALNICSMVLTSSRLMEGVASDRNGFVNFRVIIVSGNIFEIRRVWLHCIRYSHTGLECQTNSLSLLLLTKLEFEMCYDLSASQLLSDSIQYFFFSPHVYHSQFRQDMAFSMCATGRLWHNEPVARRPARTPGSGFPSFLSQPEQIKILHVT